MPKTTKPLTLTQPQTSLLSHLVLPTQAATRGRSGVMTSSTTEPMTVPLGVQWRSPSATLKVWQALHRKGVVALVSGLEPTDPLSQWRVLPGPAFADACTLLGVGVVPKNKPRA